MQLRVELLILSVFVSAGAAQSPAAGENHSAQGRKSSHQLLLEKQPRVQEAFRKFWVLLNFMFRSRSVTYLKIPARFGRDAQEIRQEFL